MDAEIERIKERLKDILKALEGDEEFFKLTASCTKKFYDALVVAGFNEGQATRIVAGQGMGIKGS